MGHRKKATGYGKKGTTIYEDKPSDAGSGHNADAFGDVTKNQKKNWLD